jgi:hypothetical protein
MIINKKELKNVESAYENIYKSWETNEVNYGMDDVVAIRLLIDKVKEDLK